MTNVMPRHTKETPLSPTVVHEYLMRRRWCQAPKIHTTICMIVVSLDQEVQERGSMPTWTSKQQLPNHSSLAAPQTSTNALLVAIAHCAPIFYLVLNHCWTMFGSIKKEIASELAHTVLCTRRLEGWQVNNEPPNENNKLQMNEVPPVV